MAVNPASVRTSRTCQNAGYGGAQILIAATLSGARCQKQVDFGFGDAVTPTAFMATHPMPLPKLPAPVKKISPVYTVIAEKLHAVTALGIANVRLKEYADLRMLVVEDLDTEVLALTLAVAATFKRRGTAVPEAPPTGLKNAFGEDRSSQIFWARSSGGATSRILAWPTVCRIPMQTYR